VPLTPADIHNVAFAKAAIGKRGYDEEQVDALLDEVSLEMVKLLEEKADLHDRAVARPVPPPPSDDAAARAGELSRLAAELRRAREACDRAERRAGELRREL